MAFFGSDGLENANKQLKAQLQSKNAQLSTLQAEQTKLLGKLDEAKKGKDTAVYDVCLALCRLADILLTSCSCK